MPEMKTPEGTRVLAEVAEEADVTYRQADHWIRKGWVNVRTTARAGDAFVFITDVDDHHPGSGYIRVIDEVEAKILCLMGRLTRVGFCAHAAAEVARVMAAGAGSGVTLGEGLSLMDGRA